MRIWRITVLRREDGFVATVARDLGQKGVWKLEWEGTVTSGRAYRMIKNAETAALRHGGDKLVIDGAREEEAVRERLARWPENIITETETGYIIDLIVPDEEGDVHEDFDDRTPLNRITCPTCVERIAHKRVEKREETIGNSPGPRAIARHTRRVAEAFTRLAEIEDNLRIDGPGPPGSGEPS